MISLIELVLGIVELLTSWRLLAGLAVTIGIVAAVVGVLPSGAMQWLVGGPVAVLGVLLSFWWQVRADEGSA